MPDFLIVYKKKGCFRCACWWTLRKHAHWQAWAPQSNEIVKVLLDLFGLLGSCGAGSYEYNPALPFKDQMWHLKDSCHPDDVESVSSAIAMSRLRVPDLARCDWFVVIDCA